MYICNVVLPNKEWLAGWLAGTTNSVNESSQLVQISTPDTVFMY